jgi:hypothetical protein
MMTLRLDIRHDARGGIGLLGGSPRADGSSCRDRCGYKREDCDRKIHLSILLASAVLVGANPW